MKSGLFTAIEAASIDSIITIDRAGAILSFNPAAERLFGYVASETLGRNVKMLMPAHFRAEHDQYLANYMRTGVRKIIGIGRIVVGLRKDGSHFPMRAVAYDKDGTTEVGRMEVSKVDKKTLDAQTFTPPATYKVVDIGQAVQGFMMGGMTGNPGEMGGPGMKGGAFPHPTATHH